MSRGVKPIPEFDVLIFKQRGVFLKGHPKTYQLGTGSKHTTHSSGLMEEGSVRSEQGNFKVYHPVPRLFCGGLGA
jgi:hypothetical protein